MDGLATLAELRKTHAKLPVIMFSTLTELGATATLDALSLGASDYVTKPSNTGSPEASAERVREQTHPEDQGARPASVPGDAASGYWQPDGRPPAGATPAVSGPTTPPQRVEIVGHRRYRPAGPTPWPQCSRDCRLTSRCRS